MADNTTLNPGTGGDVIATDDVSGVKYQIVKHAFGALDTATLVTSSVGLPVGDAGGSITVDAPVGTPVFVRLSDGAAAIATLPVDQVKKVTYRASTIAVLVAAVTADVPFLSIYGSATKTIRVQSIIISGLTLTAVQYLNIGIGKYSTAVSGGTSTSLVQVPLDSTSAAGTATNVNAYTVGPTAGTKVGNISSRRVMGQATTAAAAGIPQVVDFDFSPTGEGTSPILRGTAQGLGVYWIVAPATAVSMLARIEWTEE